MPRLTASLAVALVGWLAFAAPARADCPDPNPTHFDSCGPTFTLPAWGDAAGWEDPSQYATIQLADVNGDGKDELLGRGDAGIEIWTFDTGVGQWRPQLDANALPQILTDFRSPLPSEGTLGWNDPKYYATIQTANIDGRPGDEVVARFPNGMRAFGYHGPGDGNAIDGGEWSFAGKGPFADDDGWTEPQRYLTIRAFETGIVSRPTVPLVSLLVSHQTGGMGTYEWRGGWAHSADDDALKGCSDPACYTSLKVAPAQLGPVPDLLAADPARDLGQNAFFYNGGGFEPLQPTRGVGPLSSERNEPDCPLPGSDVCFPQAAALYETTRVANLAADLNLQLPLGSAVTPWMLVALTPEGMVAHYGIENILDNSISWRSLPVLKDLAYPASQWGDDRGKGASLMAANLDGKPGDEILALQNGQLRAWSLNADGKGWTQLQPTTPLALGDESVWSKDASHYATFRAGDIDGDGRDEVIARGPFGIRTWFYNRRGTGGWERYLPAEYPAFSGGQADAFAKLTELAKGVNVIQQAASSVRDTWTGENAPAQADLTGLQQGMLSIAQCTGLQPGLPPRYATCTLPAGVTFSVADWTAVINEVLAEIFAAEQVNAHFAELDAMRQKLFIAQGAELPAIGSALGLQAAAQTEAEFDEKEMWAGILELLGPLVGAVPFLEPAAVALHVSGAFVSMLPSATPSMTSKYETTYAGVQDEFAKHVSEAEKALAVLSQEVRQDYRLFTLLANLRHQGTWKLDATGMASVANRAFAIWAYKALLPAVYDRYEITNCHPDDPEVHCHGPSEDATYPGVIGSANGPDFTALAPPPEVNVGPCVAPGPDPVYIDCHYTSLPSGLATRIFGDVSPQCDYQPGNAATAWTFGCNLGLNPRTSVGSLGDANGWHFTPCTGNPATEYTGCDTESDDLARHSLGSDETVRVSGELRVPAGFETHQARAVATRVLYEARGNGELAGAARTSRPGRRARSARGANRRRARVTLRRLGPRRLAFDVRARHGGLRVPRACAALPRSLEPRRPIAWLETRLRLSDGSRTFTHAIRRDFACGRDRLGNLIRLRAVNRGVDHRLRRGLRSVMRLPRVVRPGGKVLVRVKLRNLRRRAPGSAFWHLRVTATRVNPQSSAGVLVRRGVRRLPGQRSKRVRLRLRVPPSARGRFCVRTVAVADLAHASVHRRCTRVRLPAAR